MNRGGRSSSLSSSISLSRPVITKLAFNERRRMSKRRGEVEGEREGKGIGGGKRRTCAREALSFSSALSFPAAFPPAPPLPFLAAVSFHPREKPAAMKIRCSLFARKPVSDIRLGVAVVPYVVVRKDAIARQSWVQLKRHVLSDTGN